MLSTEKKRKARSDGKAAREAREYARLSAIRDNDRGRSYFWWLFIVIILVNMLDEVSSTTGGTVTTNIIEDFFVRRPFLGRTYTLEQGIALNASLGMITSAISFIAPLYKTWGDRVGRKPLFVISTLGMAVGMVIVYFSRNYIVYLIGNTVCHFFLGHDMQILYVLEESPRDKRTTYYSLAKAAGLYGTIFIPMLRQAMMGNDGAKWRNIFGIPGFFGLAMALLVILIARETRPFAEKRCEVLEARMRGEAGADAASEAAAAVPAEAAAGPAKEPRLSIIAAIKLIFTNRQLRALMIAQMVFCLCMTTMSSYYQPLMNDAGMDTEAITQALVMYPILYGTLTLCSGFLADKLGRKVTVMGGAAVALLCYAGFLISAYAGAKPLLVGAFYGAYIGAYWIGKDYIEIMMTENTPTELRASVMAAGNFIYLVGVGVGSVTMMVGINFLPMWIPCLITVVPSLVIAFLLIGRNARETKGTDYEEVGGRADA